MVTIVAIPPDFNPVDEQNIEKIQQYHEWTKFIDFCNGDEKLCRELLPKIVERLIARGKLEFTEERWDCESPEFAYDFAVDLTTKIFPFGVDNIVQDSDAKCILNVMMYEPKIKYLLDPEYTYEKHFRGRMSQEGEEEDGEQEKTSDV